MNNNLVSVITPTFNSAKYIGEAITSVQRQTYRNWEMIIVDDASTDDTCSIVKKFVRNDGRIKLIKNQTNGGPAKARNIALECASGRYIAFLDSDDLWRENKLEKQLEVFREKNCPLVYSAYEKIDEKGNRQGRLVAVPSCIDYSRLLSATVIATVTAIYDTESVGHVLMPDIRMRQDYALWLKILRKGGVAHAVTEPLAYLRKRQGSVSSNKISAAIYVWKVYRDYEKLTIYRSMYHFFNYALRAFVKSRI